jgi:uncharacterized protein (TIGR00375 family)
MAGSPDVRLFADLHIHSKYSRACSRDCDLEHLVAGARRKGLTVLGTGDFTHPAWAEEIRTKLTPAEPGLFKLREDLDREVARILPPACRTPVRFLLEVEISTIYKHGDRTRKVHHLCYMPDLDAAAAFTASLARIGNIGSDGRPILGLDSRDLLEITLSAGDGAFLIPAHVWTPWFAVLGSKSGFDAVDDCYRDLAEHIFAVETGLSSNPEMNWRVPGLDRFRLVSNSDAHSPPALGRNATALDLDPDRLSFAAVRGALEHGDGYVGTVDMFPEEGKYHADGHRKCDVRLSPEQTKARGGRCPECGKPLTVGVLHRVDDLAEPGRAPRARPATAGTPANLVPLAEIMAEIIGVGPRSKAVGGAVDEIVGALGAELPILLDVPLDAIDTLRQPLLTEAVRRLRAGQVRREAGYDGEYGTISLFEPGELPRSGGRLLSAATPALFDLAEPAPAGDGQPAREPRPVIRRSAPAPRQAGDEAPPDVPAEPVQVVTPARSPEQHAPTTTGGLLDALDPDQRAAASLTEGQVLILAGPGTGKTRTLTHRLAHLVLERGVPARRTLAITFTRRACEEMRERLAVLAPEQAADLSVLTFHQLGLAILRAAPQRVGLSAEFAVADQAARLAVLREVLGHETERQARKVAERVSHAKRVLAARQVARLVGEAGGGDRAERPAAEPEPDYAELASQYTKALHARDLVDFDDLVGLPSALLAADQDLLAQYRSRYGWICVDEYQDVDESQYRLLRLLSPADGNLAVIGDPDQSIYAFRGADVGFFLRFQQDYPEARRVTLTRNYRSSEVIVAAARAAIEPTTLAPGRALTAVSTAPAADRVGLHVAGDAEAEAAFVVRTIERLLGGSSFHARDSGLVTEDGVRGGLGFDDIAVLYRTDAQSNALVEALSRHGVPFQKRSHDRLTDRPGVRAIMARFQAEPAGERPDTPALLRRAAQASIDALGGDLLAAAGDATYTDAVAEVRSAAELLAPLAAAHAAQPERFLAELELGAEVDTWDPRADRISLLTLHAAKGLEFPVVFLVGCEDGLLPLRWPGAPDDPEQAAADEAEERRLFFVGISRARTHLFLTRAERRTRHGQPREQRPSPFLDALGEDLVDRQVAGQRARPARANRQLRLL